MASAKAKSVPPADTRVVLKVDVDTAVGFCDGVRRLADLLAVMDIPASFFISMGPDHSGRALKRLVKPGFLAKQMRSGAAGCYGLRTMLYGILLPGPVIARRAPRLMNRLINLGHEVGLHGWDHVFWHDHLLRLDESRIRRELEAAVSLYRRLTGLAPASFAAPGWQVSPTAYAVLSELGISHTSCTRGRAPFRPLVQGRPLPLLELPTTLPSLDELLGRHGVSPDNAGRRLARMVRPGELNVFTLHAEVEGRGFLPVLGEFCRLLRRRGVRFLRLVDAAREAAAEKVPAGGLAYAPVPGRAGLVTWQAAALGGTR